MHWLKIALKPLALNTFQESKNYPFGLILTALLIGACSHGWQIVKPLEDGAGVAVDLSTIQDAAPIDEAITKVGNKTPYQQFGKTYNILPTSAGYSESGIASWYGSKFHGRRTSNGDIYDMYAMTAAHRTLPIPTYVRVTHLDNQKTVIVRVNDRGPFHNQRIIDLSYVAALKLGFSKSGTAEVFIEAIDRSSFNKKSSPTGPQDEETYLQIGAFDNPESAIRFASKIDHWVSASAVVKEIENSFKVLVGPMANDRELLLIKRTLKLKSNISAFRLKY